MMDNFSRGFMSKCAEFGIDGSTFLKLAEDPVPFLDTYGGRTAVSAGAGALLGAAYEAAKGKDKKKQWLRSILKGALGGAAAGAGSLAFRRNVLEPTLSAVYPDADPVSALEKAKADAAPAQQRLEAAFHRYSDSLPKLPPLPPDPELKLEWDPELGRMKYTGSPEDRGLFVDRFLNMPVARFVSDSGDKAMPILREFGLDGALYGYNRDFATAQGRLFDASKAYRENPDSVTARNEYEAARKEFDNLGKLPLRTWHTSGGDLDAVLDAAGL